MKSDSLTPDGPPPAPGAQWCPRCRNWTLREIDGVIPGGTYQRLGGELVIYLDTIIWKAKRKRCAACNSALVRPPKAVKPKKGEIRPGVLPEW